MLQAQIKTIFNSAISKVTDNISRYAVSPEKDFKRHKKLPADKLISFLISQGSSSTKVELLDFFNFGRDRPTASALNQQRAKLKPEALQQVMYEFNNAIFDKELSSGYRFIAADGSTATYFSNASFHQMNTLSARGTHSRAFTACISMLSRIFRSIFILTS